MGMAVVRTGELAVVADQLVLALREPDADDRPTFVPVRDGSLSAVIAAIEVWRPVSEVFREVVG